MHRASGATERVVGVLIISHGGFGEALILSAGHMLGKPLDGVRELRVTARDDPDKLLARGRDLVGLPADHSLLQVGGYTSALLKRSANSPEVAARDPALLPPGLSFVESLRGFEDFSLLTDRMFIADAAYRYPFIIDWGSASTLGVLPAFFARQIDFELFGSAATNARNGSRHMALGGALTLNVALWVIPFNFQYQVARRTTDDHGLVHLVTLGL